MITLLQEYTDVLREYAWFGYGYYSTHNAASRRMQTNKIKVKKNSS
jgi:hypothetical protein